MLNFITSDSTLSTLSASQIPVLKALESGNCQMSAVAGCGKSFTAFQAAKTALECGFSVESFPFAVKQWEEEKERFQGTEVNTLNFHKRGGVMLPASIRRDAFKLQDLSKAFPWSIDHGNQVVELCQRAKNMGMGIDPSVTIADVMARYGSEIIINDEDEDTGFNPAPAVVELLAASDEETSVADLDDLLRFPILMGYKTVVENSLIILDECQDHNNGSFQWLVKCHNFVDCKFLLVGDSEQGLMEFAGADAQLWHRMAEHFGCTRVDSLVSRRCSKAVIASCDYSAEIEALPDAEEGFVESISVATAIQKIAENDHGNNAVLSNTNAGLLRIALQLHSAKIPFQIENLEKVQSQIERIAGKHLWNVRGADGKYNWNTPVGEIAQALKKGLAEREVKPSPSMVDIIEVISILEKWSLENGDVLSTKRVPKIIKGKRMFFLQHPLFVSLERLMGNQGITLITGHQSKGREWNITFNFKAPMRESKKDWEIAQWQCVEKVMRTRARIGIFHIVEDTETIE